MKKALLFALLSTVVGCNTAVFDKGYDFADSRWQKSDPKTFEFTIDDASKTYDVIFTVSHIYGYQFDNVPLSFEWTKPDGTVQAIPFNLILKDKSGKELGDCSGDYCDLDTVILPQQQLAKGKHKIVASHQFSNDYLPNIFQIGLEVLQVKH